VDKPKVYVIDTNIILNNWTVPFSLQSDIVIPQIVIQELDKKKDFENKSTAYNARSFNRRIKSLLKQQNSTDLLLSNGSSLRLIPTHPQTLQDTIETLGLDPNKNDSYICAQAWLLRQDGENAILCTNDANMWVNAVTIGVPVEDYEVVSSRSPQEQMYAGVANLRLPFEQIDAVYRNEDVYIDDTKYPDLHPNQVLVIKPEDDLVSSSLIAFFKGYDRPIRRMKRKKEQMHYAGISPLNKEQSFAYELLDDARISCVTICGRAGTGKSVVALSYAIENLRNNTYDKILILKPIIPVGRELGYLPGTLEEKLGPWIKSFKDVLDMVFKEGDYEKDGQTFSEKAYQYLLDSNAIEFQPLTFMRGRTLTNTLVILDEAQNTSIHEMKTLITRVGEGSKIIMMGDIDQVDAPYLDRQNNGLAYLVEKAKDTHLTAHITFIKSHRSDLADWASDTL